MHDRARRSVIVGASLGVLAAACGSREGGGPAKRPEPEATPAASAESGASAESVASAEFIASAQSIAPAESTTSSAPSAAATREVFVYFPREGECEVHSFPRRVPAGAPLDVVRASLQALLDGPTPEEAAGGFVSAIPDSLEVLRHRMRSLGLGYDSPHEGKRVRIESLEARPDGILEVSFSRELNAYDRGATRVCAILRQVQETVRQFPEWKGVFIAIEGKTEGILQP